jgi:beta-glucosidase/6-phospho-beta-glucosidase/beta-galactosidase
MTVSESALDFTAPSFDGDGPAAPLAAHVRFGAATAAFQIEGATRAGGRGESIWDRFCATPGAVANGDTGDVACDHYRRFEDDLDLMAALGLESYRFSIAWPRVQPLGRGAANANGLRFYRALAEGLRERGIEPIATLYHWDLPQALQDEGGWAARDTTQRFADYAALVGDALGDVVRQWITHNEPWVVAFLGHAYGTKAPGVRDWPTALRVSHHLLVSHGLGVQALRAAAGERAQVGIALNLAPVHAAGPGADHRSAAARMDGHLNRWFLDPLLRGRYPDDMLDLYERRFGPLTEHRNGDLPVIREPIDFLGVNYYARSVSSPRRTTGRCACGTRHRRRRRRRWGGRSTPAGCTSCCCGCGATTARCPSTSPRTGRRSTTRRRPRPRRGPAAHGVPAPPSRGARARGRRRGRRAPLLRVVAAGQLRVGARLRQALRHRPRRLPHAAAVAEAQRALVPRLHRVDAAPAPLSEAGRHRSPAPPGGYTPSQRIRARRRERSDRCRRAKTGRTAPAAATRASSRTSRAPATRAGARRT